MLARICPQKDKKTFNLYIFGDKAAPHGDVVDVLNTARELGIEKVMIETNVDETQNE